MPDPLLRSMVGRPPSDWFTALGLARRHCWRAPSVHGSSRTFHPFCAPAWIVRHIPWIRSVPSCTNLQAWAALPLQDQTSAVVPEAAELPTSVRHFPPRSSGTGPTGPTLPGMLTVQPNETDEVRPCPSEAVTVAVNVPGVTGQPVTRPLLLIATPGGSPVPEYVSACPATGSADLTCRPTGLPAR